MARNRYFEDEKTAKINKSSLRHALWYMKPYKKTIIPLAIAMLVLSFIALLPMRIMSIIVDNVLTKSGTEIFGVHVDWLPLAIFLVVCYALATLSEAVFAFFRTKYMSVVGHGMVHDMRLAVYENLQKLAFDYYDSRPNGKILVRATTYLDELANIFSSSLIVILISAFKILFIVVWLFVIDVRLASIMLLAMIPMGIGIYFLKTAISQRRRYHREKRSNRTAYMAETIQGQQTIVAFGRKEKNNAIFSSLDKDVRTRWAAWGRVNEFSLPLLEGMFYVGLLVVYWVSLFIAQSGDQSLTIGALISFFSFSGMLSAPINEITTQLQETTSAIANLESVMEVIETETTVSDEKGAIELPQIEGNVKYDNVTFAYEKTPILQGLSFEVPKGKMVALVGPTGAGKSTVVNLLTRFYNLNGGTITIDGNDISKVTLHSLRSQIGVMMQDSFIFSGTIIDNIRYGKPDATDEECIAAAKLVCADEFISELPDGYYTKTVEQGARLSTGQRQLISFARVVLTDPRILILDEATASIDTHTEELIQKALDVLLKDRTSFVIAHRLSTIKKADCIMYIADKGIAEAGTHSQLMEKKGLYYNLVESSKSKRRRNEIKPD